MPMGRPGRTVAALAIVAASVAGCTGGTDRNSAGGSAGSRTGDAGKAAGQPAGASTTAARALPALGRPPVTDRSIIYTANLTVRTKDVATAAARAESIAAGAGGYVFSSDTAVGPAGGSATTATVVVKVPPGSFPAVLRSLAELGTLLGRNSRADDATDRVVDVAARVRSQQASVARVRTLLAQARTVGEVVAVESELTKREADFESLQGRQRALDAQVALSTVTLRLVTPAVASTTGPVESRGFLAGLRSGWHAFTGALVASLTVVGALLPFAVGLAIVLLLVVPLRRALLARRRAAAASH